MRLFLCGLPALTALAHAAKTDLTELPAQKSDPDKVRLAAALLGRVRA